MSGSLANARPRIGVGVSAPGARLNNTHALSAQSPILGQRLSDESQVRKPFQGLA